MAISKVPFLWSIQGGLDTLKSPLVVQPGSSLTLDNVIQERVNEWRRRNGFTQVVADSNFLFSEAPPFLGNVGDQGMAITSWRGNAIYSPTKTSNKWLSSSLLNSTPTPVSDDLERTPIVVADSPSRLGFASDGTTHISVQFKSTSNGLQAGMFDSAGKIFTQIGGGTGATLRARCCAGPSGYMVAVFADSAGNLGVVVGNSTNQTFGSAAPTTIKTGMHATQPYLDAHWYGGATVTIVCREAADTIRFIEYNPATATVVTDTAIAGVSCANCLSLIMEPSGSGIRMIGTSHTTPTTRVVRVNSAGAVQTNDQVEAVNSSQITGCGTASGASWGVAYQKTAGSGGTIRINSKLSGVVGTPANYNGLLTAAAPPNAITLDGQGWGEPGESSWFFLIGAHSSTATDPQDTWLLVSNVFGTGVVNIESTVVSLQAAPAIVNNAELFQAVRTGPRSFYFGVPVQNNFVNAAGVLTRSYVTTAFDHTLLSSAEIGVNSIGFPVVRDSTTFFPANSLRFVDGASAMPAVGLASPPRQVTLTPSVGAGALTLLAQYQYVVIIEIRSQAGDIWRSPVSVPAAVTLTGAQNTVAWTFIPWDSEDSTTLYRLKLYRTAGNGSVFRLISTSTFSGNGTGAYTAVADLASDASIVSGELVYFPFELENAITPPPNQLMMHDDRLWIVSRDYRSTLSYSKNLRPGRQPEFTGECVIDLDDQFGDVTALASIEGRGVLFKHSAIYFLQGEGFDDGGGGTNYTVTRISDDVGAISGSRATVAGDTVYFVSDRGIYSVNVAGKIAFAGAAVDQYLNQPLIQARETIYDSCFVSARNEVRFVTTNYILVYNRTFDTWTRWTGLAGMKRCLVINGKMVLFRGSDGAVFREGDETQLTDQGIPFTGEIRSPWIRLGADGMTKPTPAQQGMRVYRTRAVMTRTTGGGAATLIGKFYRNNSDTVDQTFTSGAIGGSVLTPTGEMHPTNQKCTSFSVGLTLPSGDVSVRLEGFSAVIGIRGGELRLADGNKWA